jgi:hypothetical protein
MPTYHGLDDLFDAVNHRRLLAIDLGGTTGWAMWGNGVVTSGSIDLTKKQRGKRFEGPGMKFVRFDRWLRSLSRLRLVSFEEVRRHRGVAAAHCYGGYLSHLTAFCDTQDPQVPYEGYGVGTIKKRATGNGAATKEMMIDACSKLGITPTDDNEADALWILVLMVEAEGLAWPGGPVPPPPEKIKKKKKKKGVKKNKTTPRRAKSADRP